MRERAFVCTMALAALLARAAFAQDKPATLIRASGKAQIDGAIAAGEYSLTVDLAKTRLSLLWTDDTLAIAVTAETKGWVAVGLGSRLMDQAVIFIGYVTGDQAQMKIQKGAGHSHEDVDLEAMTAYAVAEKGKKTTMELALKAPSFIASDQTVLDLIVAFGGSDSFSALHRYRTALSVALQRSAP
jgi:hypothetical protein